MSIVYSIRKFWLIVVIISLVGCGGDDDGTDDNTPGPSNEFSAIETRTLELINVHRSSQGLSSLTMNEDILISSRTHSQNMADGSEDFGHNGFDTRIDALAMILSFSSSAENVALNQGVDDPAAQAVDSWLNSPGHLENIEGDYDLTGLGVAQAADGTYYFTQIFVKSN